MGKEHCDSLYISRRGSDVAQKDRFLPFLAAANSRNIEIHPRPYAPLPFSSLLFSFLLFSSLLYSSLFFIPFFSSVLYLLALSIYFSCFSSLVACPSL